MNYLPPLRVPQVDAALNWAWLADMGQGNFKVAKEAAEIALAQRTDADTLFARGVVHQLQGEYQQALQKFEEAFAVTFDVDRQLIITATAYLTERQRGDILPDGLSIDFPESQQRWGGYAVDSEWRQRWDEVVQQVNSSYARLEAGFIYHISAMMPTFRSTLVGLTDESGRETHLDSVKKQLDSSIKLSQSLDTKFIIETISHFITDLYAYSGKLDLAFNELDTLSKNYSETDNNLGLAWCWLHRGDIITSTAPVGHPLLFGYRLRDSTTDTTIAANRQLFDRSKINFTHARAAYQEAKRYYSIAGAVRGQAMVRLRLAYLDAIEGEWQQAAQGYDKARRSFAQVGDRLNVMAANFGLLWVNLQRGEPIANLITQAEAIANATKKNQAIAFGLSFGLAFAYTGRDALATKGDIEIALGAARIAQTIFAVLDTPLRQAQICGDRSHALATIESVAASLNEREKALMFLRKAVENSADNSLNSTLLAIQSAMSRVSLAAGQYDAERLERVLSRANDLILSLCNHLLKNLPQLSTQETQALATGNLIIFLVIAGAQLESQWQLSVTSVWAICEVQRLIKDQVAFYAPFSRGIKAMETGKDIEAEEEFNKALNKAQGNREENFRKGMVFAAWRKYAEARTALQKYIAEGMPHVTNLMEQMQFQLNPQQAEQEQQQKEIDLRWQLVRLFVTIKKWEDARSQLNQIEVFTGKLTTLGILPSKDDILNHSYHGLVAEGHAELKTATRYLRQAVAAMENRRRYLRQENLRRATGGQRTTLALYANLARVLFDSGDLSEAFAVAEKVRARVLLEAMSGAKTVTDKLKNNPIFRRYTEQTAIVERLTNQITIARSQNTDLASNLEKQLEQAVEELDKCEVALFQAEPQWRELSAPQTEILSLEQVANYLPPGTLLLTYIVFGERLLAWAVTRDGLQEKHSLSELDGKQFVARPFAAKARNWVESLRERKTDDKVGELLARVLIVPFDTQIAAANHLLIVPFAELNMFPFGALTWRNQPLGLQKSISYLPAASLLQHFRLTDPQAKGALVLGNPESMSKVKLDSNKRETFAPLPAARAEALLIAELYLTKPLIDTEATEEAVRAEIAKMPKIIHLATHGYFEPDVPLASGVALANGEALSADEIMGLELKADVAILSACDTGQGKLQGSELIGLARSLIYAGARAVIVSLWKADDIATAMLMYLLHQQLHQDITQHLARALQLAKQKLSQLTAQQALDLCQTAQSQIPHIQNFDRAYGAFLEGYIGDILALGDDYSAAVEAYSVAIQILNSVGYVTQANQLQQILENREYEFYAEEGFDTFNPNKLVFNLSRYWSPFVIIGDWQ